MVHEWQKERFERLAQLVRDAVHPSEAVGLPYIGLEHIGEGSLSLMCLGIAEDATSLKNRFKRGDILFGKLRPYFRKVIRAPFDGICSTDIWVIRPRLGVDSRFLFYLMASDLFIEPIVRASEGTRMPRAQWEYAATLEILIPPLHEQRAIAHILGALDDKIELNRRMCETLEEMARAIFKAWFVDFEPVRAKMEGRWKRGQSLPGLPAELYDLFPARLVNSELGEIPEGWTYVKLGEIADVNWGDTNVTKSSYVDHGYIAFSAKGPDGFLPYFNYDCTGIVLSAIGENSGFTWLARGKWSCIKNTIRFWATDSRVSTEYLFILTHNKNIWPIRGSAQPFISQSDARNINILLPSNNLARIFGGIVEPWYARIEMNENQSHTLAALRDALLPKLISGEIRMKDAEIFLRERGL
ncbi:MAG: restriction endonuclease subunit S [Candidatus Aminicenantes bacterium]|nr:restriction endonuclease subunit S [Candidatus Aminicenantes bacterium]